MATLIYQNDIAVEEGIIAKMCFENEVPPNPYKIQPRTAFVGSVSLASVLEKYSNRDITTPNTLIKMSAQDIEFYVESYATENEPNDALQVLAMRFKEKYG